MLDKYTGACGQGRLASASQDRDAADIGAPMSSAVAIGPYDGMPEISRRTVLR